MKPTKFKKGARVLASTSYSDVEGTRKEWVLDQDVTDTREWHVAAVLSPEGHRTHVWADTIELAAPEPYSPRVGDRVRLVHEGVVDDASGTWLSIDGASRLLGKGETVELLEKAPEPFAVGTVVDSYGQVAFRTETGWVWDTGETSMFEDDWFRDPRVKILHEPPTS